MLDKIFPLHTKTQNYHLKYPNVVIHIYRNIIHMYNNVMWDWQYSAKYCQSQKTLLWIWITLWSYTNDKNVKIKFTLKVIYIEK